MVKKWLKIVLSVIAVLLIAISSFAIWQWENIKSIYLGINETPEEITRRRNENQTKLVEDINDYLEKDIREFTPEEKAKIESGELKAEDVYRKIFEEEYEKTASESKTADRQQSDTESGETEKNESEMTDKSKSNNSEADEAKNTVSVEKVSKDTIVLKHMARIYSLQNEYNAKAEVTVAAGRSYYKNLRKTQDSATARTNTITHYTPIVRGVESECDGKFNAIIAEFESELNSIGEDTGVITTVQNAYATEKQLKLSYYANKYLK